MCRYCADHGGKHYCCYVKFLVRINFVALSQSNSNSY